MEEPIESQYFNWLCHKVNDVSLRTPTLTYTNLLRAMHQTEFVWQISGDDNRAEDGIDLRTAFLREAFLSHSHIQWWNGLGCSVLEMLIALSSAASFDTDRPQAEWFWEFVENLGLRQFNDANPIHPEVFDDIMERFIWREYEPDGQGGLFPIRNPEHDQRGVEIWYQFCEYLVDQERG